MATKTERARILYEAWRGALATHRSTDNARSAAIEQEAFDELVEFVEANDLNHTSWDPR